MKRCQKLPPCLTEPLTAISKKDLPLAKAEIISDGGSASAITYLRKGKKHCANVVGENVCERNNCSGTKGSEEGGERGVPSTRAQIPLQSMKTPR